MAVTGQRPPQRRPISPPSHTVRSGQRSPGSFSRANSRSTPPPSSSRSTSSASPARWASAAASTEAPAPPWPGNTASSAPAATRSSRTPPPASARARSRACSSSGSRRASPAPDRQRRAQRLRACLERRDHIDRGPAWAQAVRGRRGVQHDRRRGLPGPPVGGGAGRLVHDAQARGGGDAVEVLAQGGVGDEGQHGGVGHPPTVRRRMCAHQSGCPRLGMNPDLCRTSGERSQKAPINTVGT